MTNQKTNLTNAAETTLTSGFGAGATTLNVSNTSAFPATPFYATIDPGNDAKREIVLVDDGKTGTTLTLSSASSRGQDGTSDVAHDDGAVVAVVAVAAHFTDLNDRVDAAYSVGGTDVPITDGGTGASTAAGARTNLGVPALTGATFTGEVAAPNVQLGVGVQTNPAGYADLDFSGDGFLTHAVSSAITYTTSNLAAGRSLTLRATADASSRDLNFPAEWTFVGVKPSSIAASKVGILTLTSFGTTDSDVVAAWSVQQ